MKKTKSTRTLLTKQAIFDAPDLKEKYVDVPEWPNGDGSPGTLRLLEMDAKKSIELTQLLGTRSDDGMFIILAFSAVDEDGNLVFTIEDVEALKEKNLNVIDRLQRICLRLNDMRVPGVNLGATEDLLKNVLSEAVPSASPTN